MHNVLLRAVVVSVLSVLALFVVMTVARAESEASPNANEDAGRQSRPNIIFLLTDDQRDNTLGAMGHPFVKTPNMDRLLRQSLRFRNTYIAEPTCSPSRTALFTGMHERVNGVGFTSSYQLNEAQWERTYPALLRKAGYYTGFIGKFGVEYYTFKGRADKEFDFWRGHDGWTRFFPEGLEQSQLHALPRRRRGHHHVHHGRTCRRILRQSSGRTSRSACRSASTCRTGRRRPACIPTTRIGTA